MLIAGWNDFEVFRAHSIPISDEDIASWPRFGHASRGLKAFPLLSIPFASLSHIDEPYE